MALFVAALAASTTSAWVWLVGGRRFHLARSIDRSLVLVSPLSHDEAAPPHSSPASSSCSSPSTTTMAVGGGAARGSPTAAAPDPAAAADTTSDGPHSSFLYAQFLAHSALWELEFPFLGRMAFHLALLRAFAVPNVARAFAAPSTVPTLGSGDLSHRSPNETIMHPLDVDGFGLSPFENMSADDRAFLVAALMVEPCNVVEAWGYRKLSEAEKEATCAVWRTVALHLGVRRVPSSFAAAKSLLEARAISTKTVKPHPAAARLATATIDAFLSSALPPVLATLLFDSAYSKALLPFAQQLVHSVMDPHTRASLRIPEPGFVVTATAKLILWMHGAIVRYALLPRSPTPREAMEMAQHPLSVIPARHVASTGTCSTPPTTVYPHSRKSGRMLHMPPPPSPNLYALPPGSYALHADTRVTSPYGRHTLDAFPPLFACPSPSSWPPTATATIGATTTRRVKVVVAPKVRGRVSIFEHKLVADERSARGVGGVPRPRRTLEPVAEEECGDGW